VFLLVRCRAWNSVTQSLRPLCYSLVDAQRSDRYVRHYGYYLRLDSEHDPTNSSSFDNDSSFFFHGDTFYPGYYAFESVNQPDFYIQPNADGRLLIRQRSDSADYNDTASFRISEYMSGKCTAMLEGKALRLFPVGHRHYSSLADYSVFDDLLQLAATSCQL